MNKNVSVIGIILLFFLSLANPIVLGFNDNIPVIKNNGNILFVGGGGPGNYTTIKSAIEDAIDGDTIFVFDDSSPYYENDIILSKSIRLLGENKETTIIEGGDEDILFIYANNVSLFRFKIQNGRFGIRLESSSGVLISDNILTNNRLDGILMSNSSYNTIINNSLSFNDNGITLDWTLSAPGPCLYNNILNNTISNNNYRGIQCSLSQRYNHIIGNTIENNTKEGVMICCNSYYNVVYHNNFKVNGINAKDEYNNTWDDGYPSGGNYWDDYTGIDEDGDGIGDTPYNISDSGNQDRYPLMNPWGENLPPEIPIINGPVSGKPGIEYNFSFKSTDTEGNDLHYIIDWDDGYEDITGNFPSGTEVYVSHSWNTKGTYTIKAKAVDTSGAESDWGKLTVTIPRNIVINSQLLQLLHNHPKMFMIIRLLLH